MGDPTHQVTGPFDLAITWHLKNVISPNIAPKLGRVVTQLKFTPPIKLRDHVVAYKTENVISTLPQNLWQQNLAGWWLRVGNVVPPLLTIILMHCKKFYCKQSILQVLLLLHLLLHFWMWICTTFIIYDTLFLIILIEPC